MFVDASVLVAVFNEEEDASALEQQILEAQSPVHVSPMVKFEASMAIARTTWERTGGVGGSRAVLLVEARNVLDTYLAELDAIEIPITAEIGNAAIDAAATYGKVVGHGAGLNLGDCFSYACAKSLSLPLLYKGNDFSQTDLA